jgi:hypothetical protein
MLKGALALIATVVACASAPAAAGAAELTYGLTSGDALVSFASNTPGTTSSPVAITNAATGLPLLSDVVGIDVRPATGQLYALVKSATPTANGTIWRIDPNTAIATLLTSTPFDLNGTNFGLDFNPTSDRIRIVAEDTRQNLRANPNTGDLVQYDGILTYALGDPKASGFAPGVSGVAYTNNVPTAGTTELLAIDRANNTLALQNPPNNGTLNTRANLTGVIAGLSPSVGFDISASGLALAAATPTGSSTRSLYAVNTTTGALSPVGAFPATVNVDDIAIAQTAVLFAAVTAEPGGSQDVFLFSPTRPNDPGPLRPITGLAESDEQIIGIDSRPATGTIVALTNHNRLYNLDPLSGAVAAGRSLTGGNASLSDGTTFGVDFNPLTDRLGVTLNTALSDRSVTIAPDSPSLVTPEANVDYPPTDPGTGTNPRIVAKGFTNAVPAATSTQQYDIDAARNFLVTQDSPTGTLTSVGTSGLFTAELAGATITDTASLDIVPGLNTQYAALQRTGNAYSELFALNGAGNGQAVLVGRLGSAATPLVGSITALLPAPSGPGPGPGPGGGGTTTPPPGAGTSGIPGVDKVAPIALVVANTLQAKTLRANGLSVLMFCNERCAVSTRLLAGKTVIGSGKGSLTKAGDTRFRFKLTAAGRAKTPTNRNTRLGLESTVVDAAGNSKVTRTALTALKTLPPSAKTSARTSAVLDRAQADTVAPVSLVVANGLQATKLRLDGLSVLYACDGPCNVKTNLLAGDTVIGTGSSSIKEAGIARFRFKLNANGRRIITQDASRRLGLESTVSDPAGNKAKQRTALTVRRVVR